MFRDSRFNCIIDHCLDVSFRENRRTGETQGETTRYHGTLIRQLVCGAVVKVYFVIFTEMADKFETLEEQLERFIENTRQMGIIVSDFQPQGQNALNQKL